MSKEKEFLYLCDPSKALNCKKTMCFIKGGPCDATINPEEAVIVCGHLVKMELHPADISYVLIRMEAV